MGGAIYFIAHGKGAAFDEAEGEAGEVGDFDELEGWGHRIRICRI